ncbi:hemolysin XhlA family protein [Clostridium scatologenes]|uniref:Hemolysin XhlA n=1 Tax=Clostridium scatologenes TaxID=1548 RepID=A0A0E3M7A1_CLOSL|nr:hemolysin XhlA family protein [Clostridium scatologenes]AKA70119.1 hypothetical protein CSCA_2994 [Clostridium scatologenes]
MNNEDIKDKIEDHEQRLREVEKSQSEFKIEIKNLCDSLKTLTNTIKWFCGIWVTSLLGFFFYAIQNHIFK